MRTARFPDRLQLVVVALLAVVTLLPASVGRVDQAAAADAEVVRTAGADRVATAIAVAVAAFPDGGAAGVVLASADRFPDALVGAPLAVAAGGPLLLTGGATLDDRVAAELSRVLAPGGTVVLLGGTAALSSAVEDGVASLGFAASRRAGADRFATALEVCRAGLGDPGVAVLATGLDFPDALGAGALAAQLDGCVLLTAGDVLPAAVSAYLDERGAALRLIAVGGQAARAVPGAEAVVGGDRYATSATLVDRFLDGDQLAVASGAAFPDALAAGPDVARRGGLVLLTAPDVLPGAARNVLALRRTALTAVRVYGGTAAVSDAVVAAIAEALAVASSPGSDWDLVTASPPVLRGADVYQRRNYAEVFDPQFGEGPTTPPLIAEDFARLAAAGATSVNLSHAGIFTEVDEGAGWALDEPVAANLDRLLDLADEAGLAATIAFRTGPGRNEFTFLQEEDPSWLGRSLDHAELWTDADAQAAWAQMLRVAVQRYGDHPALVSIDPLIEPNPHVTLCDSCGPDEFEQQFGGTVSDWNTFWPDLVAAIRAEDPDLPILLEPAGWGSPAWLRVMDVPSDANVATAVHTYEPFAYTHQEPDDDLVYPGDFDADGDGDVERVDVEWLEAEVFGPVDAYIARSGLPVVVNEYGAHRWADGAPAFLDDLHAGFVRRGIASWIWVWDPVDPAYAVYYDAFHLLFGTDPDTHADVEDNPLMDAMSAHWRDAG